jgi:iron/manganese superoxide dismutase-like protein
LVGALFPGMSLRRLGWRDPGRWCCTLPWNSPWQRLRTTHHTFGSFTDLKARLKQAAVNQFGSGWAWPVHDDSGLAVIGPANQDSPCPPGRCRFAFTQIKPRRRDLRPALSLALSDKGSRPPCRAAPDPGPVGRRVWARWATPLHSSPAAWPCRSRSFDHDSRVGGLRADYRPSDGGRRYRPECALPTADRSRSDDRWRAGL